MLGVQYTQFPFILSYDFLFLRSCDQLPAIMEVEILESIVQSNTIVMACCFLDERIYRMLLNQYWVSCTSILNWISSLDESLPSSLWAG